MQLGTYQQIFVMFYAISYGVMLTSIGTLKAFPWGFPAEKEAQRKKQLFVRLFVSLVSFNIAPFFLFAFGLKLFQQSTGDFSYSMVVLTGLASLSVFAPYRLHHLIVAFKQELFYERKEWEEIAQERKYRKSILGHLLGIAFYLFPLLVVYIVQKCT